MITNRELPALIQRAHDTAAAHGFHDEKKSLPHWLMLIITEISEFVEADRKGRHANIKAFKEDLVDIECIFQTHFEFWIKDTVEDELADICIRIFDLAGEYSNIRLDIDNTKVDFVESETTTEHAFLMVNFLTSWRNYETRLLNRSLSRLLKYTFILADTKGIDLKFHIEQKMRYNELRPSKHGKKY